MKNGWGKEKVEHYKDIVKDIKEELRAERRKVYKDILKRELEFYSDYIEMICVEYKEAGIYRLIFSHSFAKAFWGEESKEVKHGNWDDMRTMTSEYIPAWQYHLQQMVLEEKPLKYIEKFL